MKSYCGEPIGTDQHSFEGYHPRLPTASSSPRLGSQLPPKTPIAIISGMVEAMDFRFSWNVKSIHPNKNPFKILEKMERGRIQGLPKFFEYPIFSGTGKATNFKFCTHIHCIDRNKSPLKIAGKVAVGVLRAPYIGRIAR